LAVYALLTNLWLVFALLFLVGGFAAINKYAPDATQVGEHTITQKHLYTGLFVIGEKNTNKRSYLIGNVWV
jgi:PRA1 family protein 1